jgi:lactate dehydrogenase-like 2-hydroxyacid dehydrogenase
MTRPAILLLSDAPTAVLDALEPIGPVTQADQPADREAFFGRAHAEVRVVVTTGHAGLRAHEIDLLPALELVCSQGVGYENIAVAHARSRGVAVAHAPGVNSDSVADHALALTLASLRRIVPNHLASLQGRGRHALPRPGQLQGRRVGLFGLGNIGERIARRLSGFDAQVGYLARSRRADVAYRHFGSLLELARWSEVLILAAPGGPQTRHAVTLEVLEALGPNGTLVNVARASLVDEQALATALERRLIAGCALDVWEGEPRAPARFGDDPRVVLSPHVGGQSPEATANLVERLVDNLQGHLSGRGVVSPVP